MREHDGRPAEYRRGREETTNLMIIKRREGKLKEGAQGEKYCNSEPGF